MAQVEPLPLVPATVITVGAGLVSLLFVQRLGRNLALNLWHWYEVVQGKSTKWQVVPWLMEQSILTWKYQSLVSTKCGLI